MQEEQNLGGVGVSFRDGEEVQIVVANVEVLTGGSISYRVSSSSTGSLAGLRTLMPSLEKHGGTAELSSSASLRRIGNFSTADMGMSPR